MSIEASKGDLYLYCNAALVNHCPFDYWTAKTEEQKEENVEFDNIVEGSSDAKKSGRAFGWYVAGMGHCLVAMIGKVVNFIAMIGVNIILGINYAILKNENEQGEERQIRCKIALYVLADTALSIGVDFIGIFCPPAAYKIHSLIEDRLMAPAFISYKKIESKEEYSFSNFFEQLKTASTTVTNN